MNELDDSTTTVLRSEGRSQGDSGLTWLLKVEESSFQSHPSVIISAGIGLFFAHAERLLQAAYFLLGRRLTSRADLASGQSS